MKRLVVMRHARPEQVAATDHQRPLSEGGRDDAAAVGRWLAAQGIIPDRALVSDALRTRETWAAVCAAAGWAIEADFDRSLYTGGEDTVCDLLRDLDETAHTVLVIGHNPTMSTVAMLLDDGEGDPEAGNELAVSGYPAGAVALFEYAGSWPDLAHYTATIRAFHVPGFD